MRRNTALLSLLLVLAGCGYDYSNTVYGGPQAPANIALTVSSAAAMTAAGDTRTITAVVTDQDHNVIGSPTVAWSSSAPTVATVAGSGNSAVVTGVDDGTAVITATSGNATRTITVQVHRVVASVRVTSGVPAMAPGQTTPLTAVALDARQQPMPNVTNFTYLSSNPARAVVAPNGIVTAILPVTQVSLIASVTRDGFVVSGTTTLDVVVIPDFDYATFLLGSEVRPQPVVTDGDGLVFFRQSNDHINFLVTWSGLFGTAVAAHLHGPATDLQEGDLLVELSPTPLSGNFGVLNGTINAASIRPQNGRPPISLDSLVSLMRRNLVYVDLTSTQRANGELRGQVEGPLR